MFKNIIFDFGGVLVDWNPKYLYKKLFAEEAAMEEFLGNVCTSDWNEQQDEGRTLKEGTEALVQCFPEKKELIEAYYGRWEEMLAGPIAGTVAILEQLKKSGKHKLFGLTNWSAETFPIALRRFDFFSLFDGILVSGTERLRKPHPAFYQLLLDRYHLMANECLFIDDNIRNTDAARQFGIQSITFENPDQLKEELIRLQVL
ncbi:HAD family phosphatase [Olivibacter sp. LS-1]|jgi:2-haloacid dehalogenase|uniref:HAD family hydrolase n=1 Tax=Olivibacter sp. LS-1 TaxID=2592345 RepID=UPI0011EAF169|nr:HAD family phosphatase [Olivibacter sp. LS-1]QEL00317.1 HAD family phosphatase [Olivibacter sp. LS-1]